MQGNELITHDLFHQIKCRNACAMTAVKDRFHLRKLLRCLNDNGFFFLGIVLGSIFLCAAVLIMYYKQISEGY